MLAAVMSKPLLDCHADLFSTPNPDLAAYLVALGHPICGHSEVHPSKIRFVFLDIDPAIVNAFHDGLAEMNLALFLTARAAIYRTYFGQA